MEIRSLEGFCQSVVTRSGALTGVDERKRAVGIEPISAITFLMTVIPQALSWLKECRSLKNDEVQGHVTAQSQDARTRTQQEGALQNKLRFFCKQGRIEEKRRARSTGVPADLNRYSYDDKSLGRISHNIIGNFLTMTPVDAEALVSSCS